MQHCGIFLHLGVLRGSVIVTHCGNNTVGCVSTPAVSLNKGRKVALASFLVRNQTYLSNLSKLHVFCFVQHSSVEIKICCLGVREHVQKST